METWLPLLIHIAAALGLVAIGLGCFVLSPLPLRFSKDTWPVAWLHREP